jgi:5-methylcytosine-specific restriction endonuclease McrA
MSKDYELPAPGTTFDPQRWKLGGLCKHGHDWADGQSLRHVVHGYCAFCRADPEAKVKRAKAAADRRNKIGRPSRSKNGAPYLSRNSPVRAMRRAIKGAGKLPSIDQLVRDQQSDHWRNHPRDRLAYVRQRARLNEQWKYLTDHSHRLYHRAKSKARKVKQRGGTPSHLTADHLWRHWNAFNQCCAYCGVTGDLEIEHVVPISRGGQHCLSNIVPACHDCNSNKGTKDAHAWYNSKSFYSDSRWQRIQSVLGKAKPINEQLFIPFLAA